LLAGAGTVTEAETALQQGIDVARRQNAKSWELRAATSLARLRRQQGRPQEATALLAPILGWFSEGFDTADLREAKALLDQLTEPAIAAEG
jgi:predicted ATPase